MRSGLTSATRVKKGQMLYTIESQQYEAQSAAQLSKLAEAKTNLAHAESELARIRPLAENNAVSQSDLDAAVADFEAAKAMVEAAKRDIVKWIGLAIILCVIFSVFFARYFSDAMRYLTAIAKKIGGGEFDVQVKVRSKDELGQLGNSLQEMAGSLKDAVKVKEELFAIQAEVKIASRIQQSILPVGSPDLKGLNFGARYIPMEGVAGDFYDYHVIDDKSVGFLVADVSGHGIPAAMISTMMPPT